MIFVRRPGTGIPTPSGSFVHGDDTTAGLRYVDDSGLNQGVGGHQSEEKKKEPWGRVGSKCIETHRLSIAIQHRNTRSGISRHRSDLCVFRIETARALRPPL